jgi:hypothetical protein
MTMSTLAASVSIITPRVTAATLPPGYRACKCCGRAYSPAEWTKLPLIVELDDGLGGRLALRNCVCGATHATQLEDGPSVAKCATPVHAPPPAADAELEVAS